MVEIAHESILQITVGLNPPRSGPTGCDRTLKAAAMAAYAKGYRRAGIDEEHAGALLQRQRELLEVLQ